MSKKSLEAAAQCWCDPRVSDRVMDAELATVFAEKLAKKDAEIKRLRAALAKAVLEIGKEKGKPNG